MFFKKMTKDLLDKEIAPSRYDDEPGIPAENTFFSPLFKDQPQFNPKDEEPETIIGENVHVKGELRFESLLRVDGTFEGELISNGRLIIGPTGSVKANLNLAEAFVSGKVEGNIIVKERLVLRGRAEVHGDITAPLLNVDEGVTIHGRVHVGPGTPPAQDDYSSHLDY
jgi:cytoskeletal protein CcmA (bactofilin family)